MSIKNILKEENFEISEINKKINEIKISYDLFVDDVMQEQNNLKIIKEQIINYNVKKNNVDIKYDVALKEIAKIKTKIDENIKSIEVGNLFINNGSNPLNYGTNKYGDSFRLLYKISENNEKIKEDNNIDENLKEYIEEKRGYSDLGKFGLKVAYIKVDDEIVWRDEISNKEASKEGKFYILENGNLNIYFNKLQIKNEKLSKEYATATEERKVEILEKINKNLEEIKKDNTVPRIQLVFEDNLNIQYFLKYVDKDKKNILDPVKIKALLGIEFELNGPKYIVNKDGDKFKLLNPEKHIINTKKDLSGKNPTIVYEFVYEKDGKASLGEKFDIPGYVVEEIKMPGDKINYDLIKVQEKTNIEKNDKNNQSNFDIENQKELNIRYIGVSICSVPNCKVHTGENKGTRLNSEVIGWLHSKMYIPEDKNISLNLTPYLDKYDSGISSYGLEEKERDVKYPINIPENKLLEINKEFGKDTKKVYVNLYKVDYLPHYPSGNPDPEKKYFEYTIDHKYFNRDLELEFDEEGNPIESDGKYTPYEYVKGDYSINLKYDMGRIGSVMNTTFTNFIYKYWDNYKDYVLREDSENRTFDRLAIKQYKYNTKVETEEIEEYLVNSLELIHNPTLGKGIYKYSKVEEKQGERTYINNIYEINFTETESEDLLKSDWYEFDGFERDTNVRKGIALFKELNAAIEKDRKTIFEYYFTGSPIWTPEVVKTKIIEEHVDIMTGEIFGSDESEVYVNDTVYINKPKEEVWPEGYKYVYTDPETEKFIAKEGKNKITHYYISKDYLEVNYHGNGGIFTGGNPKDITSEDKTLRIVIAKKDELLNEYHPKDVLRPGNKFIGWGLKEEINGEEKLVLVSEEKLVEEGLNLYAIWELDNSLIPVEPPVDPTEPEDKPEKPTKPSKKKRPKKEIEEVKIEEKLDKKNHFEYIKGYPEGTVRPEGKITREEVSAVFYRLLTENYKGSIYSLENNYKDVENKRWSNKHISTLSKGKIVEGYEDGNFRPGQNVTRAEVAVIASRFDSLSSTKNNFSDVKGHWAEEYIGSASSKGWIKGYPDGSFRPDEYITRAEFVTLVNNVLERGVKKEHILKGIKEFTDLREDEWYYEAMVEAINGHIYERANTLEIWKELKDFNFDM